MRLFLADALCTSRLKCGTEHLTPWSAVADRSGRWPFCEQLLRHAAGSSQFAATQCTEADTVSAMMAAALGAAKVSSAQPAMIVYASDPVPPALKTAFPDALLAWLRRINPTNLLIIPARRCANTHPATRLPDQLLAEDFRAVALPVAPDQERFPAVGPVRPEMDAAAIRTAIQRLASTLQLTGYQRNCLEAGLLLLWDHVDESHQISQTMEGQGTPRTADYWHGIMHRREPDAGNAAWWFRRVGSHPALRGPGNGLISWMQQLAASPKMLTQARQLLRTDQTLDPLRLIELSSLVLCDYLNLGYTDRSLIRASSIFMCHSTPRCARFVASDQAVVSVRSSTSLPMRRPETHWRVRQLNSFSAMFSQLPCLGV